MPEVPEVHVSGYIFLVRFNDLINICSVGVFMEAEPLDEGGDSLLKFISSEGLFSIGTLSLVSVEDGEDLLLLLFIRHSEAHGNNISGLLLGGFHGLVSFLGCLLLGHGPFLKPG
jgi:hypothetical protein